MKIQVFGMKLKKFENLKFTILIIIIIIMIIIIVIIIIVIKIIIIVIIINRIIYEEAPVTQQCFSLRFLILILRVCIFQVKIDVTSRISFFRYHFKGYKSLYLFESCQLYISVCGVHFVLFFLIISILISNIVGT